MRPSRRMASGSQLTSGALTRGALQEPREGVVDDVTGVSGLRRQQSMRVEHEFARGAFIEVGVTPWCS